MCKVVQILYSGQGHFSFNPLNHHSIDMDQSKDRHVCAWGNSQWPNSYTKIDLCLDGYLFACPWTLESVVIPSCVLNNILVLMLPKTKCFVRWKRKNFHCTYIPYEPFFGQFRIFVFTSIKIMSQTINIELHTLVSEDCTAYPVGESADYLDLDKFSSLGEDYTYFKFTDVSPREASCIHGMDTHTELQLISAVPDTLLNMTNLPDSAISQNVRTILSFGPNFVPDYPESIVNYIFNLMKAYNGLIKEGTNPDNTFRGILHKSFSCLSRFVSAQGYRNDLPVVRMLVEMYHATHTFLTNNPDLCLVCADKGGKICLMGKKTYEAKMSDWIESNLLKRTYKVMIMYSRDEGGALFKLEVETLYNSIFLTFLEISKMLVKLYNECHSAVKIFPAKVYQRLRTIMNSKGKSMVAFPYMYGTVKTHKEGNPVRPICSTRLWLSWPVQKFIVHILTPIFADLNSEHVVSNINILSDELKSLVLFEDYEFFKLDVSDMYTSMNIRSVLNAVMHLLRMQPYHDRLGGIPLDLLEICLHFSLLEANYFTYNGTVYRQTAGFPQGACDSGLLAGVYLDWLLKKYNEYLLVQNGIIVWYRYVDDYLLYMHRNKVDEFIKRFKLLTQLDVTLEREEPCNFHPAPMAPLTVGMSISYLDIEIVRTNQPLKVYLRNYQKPYASQRMMHYLSKVPSATKYSTVCGLYHRVIYRTSDCFLLGDLEKVVSRLVVNGYPHHMVCKCYYNTLQRYLQRTAAINPYRMFLLATHLKGLSPHGNFIYKLSNGGFMMNENSSSFIVSTVPPGLYCDPDGVYVVCADIHEPSNTRVSNMHLSRKRLYTSASAMGVVYCCEEFSEILDKFFIANGQGPLIYKSGSNITRLFKLGLGDPLRPDGSLLKQTRRVLPQSSLYGSVEAYLSRCGTCDYSVVVSGTGGHMKLLEASCTDTSSPIGRHLAHHGHAPGDFSSITFNKGNLTPTICLDLLKAIYKSVGCCVEAEPKHMGVIPQFVLRGTEACVHSYLQMQEGGIPVDLGLPLPSRSFPNNTSSISSSSTMSVAIDTINSHVTIPSNCVLPLSAPVQDVPMRELPTTSNSTKEVGLSMTNRTLPNRTLPTSPSASSSIPVNPNLVGVLIDGNVNLSTCGNQNQLQPPSMPLSTMSSQFPNNLHVLGGYNNSQGVVHHASNTNLSQFSATSSDLAMLNYTTQSNIQVLNASSGVNLYVPIQNTQGIVSNSGILANCQPMSTMTGAQSSNVNTTTAVTLAYASHCSTVNSRQGLISSVMAWNMPTNDMDVDMSNDISSVQPQGAHVQQTMDSDSDDIEIVELHGMIIPKVCSTSEDVTQNAMTNENEKAASSSSMVIFSGLTDIPEYENFIPQAHSSKEKNHSSKEVDQSSSPSIVATSITHTDNADNQSSSQVNPVIDLTSLGKVVAVIDLCDSD